MTFVSWWFYLAVKLPHTSIPPHCPHDVWHMMWGFGSWAAPSLHHAFLLPSLRQIYLCFILSNSLIPASDLWFSFHHSLICPSCSGLPWMFLVVTFMKPSLDLTSVPQYFWLASMLWRVFLHHWNDSSTCLLRCSLVFLCQNVPFCHYLLGLHVDRSNSYQMTIHHLKSSSSLY